MSEQTGLQEGMRVGIFGGTFNPPHIGHTNVLTTVHGRLNLDRLFVVPAAQNPFKPPVEGPTDQQRLEMAEKAFGEYEFVSIDDQEIVRGGMSYTVETVERYAKVIAPQDLYLIVGLDQFEEFDKWKDFERILTLANLVVVTRPKHSLPFTKDELPKGIQSLVADFDRQFLALKSERSIEFVRLQDVDVSSTEVRKRLRTERNVDRYLDIKVEDYIKQNSLYASLGPRIGDYEAFTKFCAQVLFDKKALNVRAFDLTSIEAVSEYTLIASGTSTRHTSALAENIQRAVKEEFNVFPQAAEGTGEGRWVVLDYGSLIIHLFYDFIRMEYRLEDLWKSGKDLGLVDQTLPPKK